MGWCGSNPVCTQGGFRGFCKVCDCVSVCMCAQDLFYLLFFLLLPIRLLCFARCMHYVCGCLCVSASGGCGKEFFLQVRNFVCFLSIALEGEFVRDIGSVYLGSLPFQPRHFCLPARSWPLGMQHVAASIFVMQKHSSNSDIHSLQAE